MRTGRPSMLGTSRALGSPAAALPMRILRSTLADASDETQLSTTVSLGPPCDVFPTCWNLMLESDATKCAEPSEPMSPMLTLVSVTEPSVAVYQPPIAEEVTSAAIKMHTPHVEVLVSAPAIENVPGTMSPAWNTPNPAHRSMPNTSCAALASKGRMTKISCGDACEPVVAAKSVARPMVGVGAAYDGVAWQISGESGMASAILILPPSSPPQARAMGIMGIA